MVDRRKLTGVEFVFKSRDSSCLVLEARARCLQETHTLGDESLVMEHFLDAEASPLAVAEPTLAVKVCRLCQFF